MKADKPKEEGFRAFERFSENPFMSELVASLNGRRVSASTHRSTSTVTQVYEIDPEQFVKVYTGELAVWLDIGKAALRVLIAMMMESQTSSLGKGVVLFDVTNKYAVEFKISKAAYYRGLDELVAKRFIAKSKTTALFFINPAIFFNGDRARFVREYRIKQKDTSALDSAV